MLKNNTAKTIKQSIFQWRAAWRDALLVSLIILSISAFIGYFIYNQAAKSLHQEVQNNLISLAKSAAELTDTEKHKKITQPEDKGSALYEQIRAPYIKLLKANPSIAFIYTAIEKDSKIFFILDSAITKPGEEDDTSDVMEEYTDATDIMRQAFKEQKPLVEDEAYTDNWGTFLSAYAPIFDKDKKFIGIIGTDIRITDYLNRVADMKRAFIIGMLLAFVASLCVGIAVWVTKKKALLSEKLSFEQQAYIKQQEETQKLERDQQKSESRARKKQEMEELAQDFEDSVSQVLSEVVSAVQIIESGIGNVAKIADDTKVRSQEVLSNASLAAHSTQEVALSANHLAGATAQIADKANTSTTIAAKATIEAQSAKETIEILSEKSAKINSIVEVISKITDQINLLSLNATIEAARAGESGKGFAVVAGEVKNLATQVAIATQDISEQIQGIQSSTQDSVDVVMNVINTINEISEHISNMSEAVDTQTQVTHEITRNIDQAAIRSQNISHDIAFVQNGAENTNSMISEALLSAHALSEKSMNLQTKVANFITKIRK